MKYNTDIMVLEFADSLTGGRASSTIAESNPGAANNNETISFALAAFVASTPVEVVFGGGCQNGHNWFQTIKLVK
jgi:hypothetical protein